jgi:cytosine/adenosine deaminase-related metal-dependent hydrolase
MPSIPSRPEDSRQAGVIDLLLTAGTVITVDADRRVIRDGAIAVDDGRIVAVGPASDLVPAHQALERIDLARGVAMPGLVDAHSHAGHGLIRTMGDDLALWLETCRRVYLHGATPDFWFAEAQLTASERLLSGTTTALAMLGGAGDTIRSDDPAHAAAHLQGATDVGVRAVVVVGPGAPPFPKHTTAHGDGEARSIAASFDGQMAVTEAVVDAWDGHPLASVAVTYPTLTMEEVAGGSGDAIAAGAAAVADLAADRGLRIVQDGHRGATVAATERLGLLGDRTLLSHAVDLDDSQIALLATAGAAVAHNPAAVYSQIGRCPVPELIDAGVTVGLGSDATAPDRSADLFRHLFQLTRYHRVDRRDPALFPPGTALEMATIGSARALGMGDEIGSLEVGKAADIILIDVAKPHLTPLTHPVQQLVYYATGADVDTVVVDGVVRMRGRELAYTDVDEVLNAAVHEQEAAFARGGIEPAPDRAGLWGAARYVGGAGVEI